MRIDPAVFGGSLNWVDRIHATNKDTDMQMKVLYEYGNCQYNFSRSGAPTRILPNVVPVGPSPGIPQLDLENLFCGINGACTSDNFRYR